MEYEEAVGIAHYADTLPVEVLYQKYEQFNAITDNTPNWIGEQIKVTHADDLEGASVKVLSVGKSLGWQRAFHAAQGMVTEAGELLSIVSKPNYHADTSGNNHSHIIEELGDMTYYVTQYVRALNEQGLNLPLTVVLGDEDGDIPWPLFADVVDLAIATTDVLDLFKKELYGKQKRAGADLMSTKLVPVVGGMKKVMSSLRANKTPVRFRTLIADNTKKLANRYIEKFGR